MIKKWIFLLDAIGWSLLSGYLLFSSLPSATGWIIQNKTTTPTTTTGVTSVLVAFLGLCSAFPILPFLFASVTPSVHIPTLLFSSLFYGSITVMLLVLRLSIVNTIWNIAITITSSLSVLHFLAFSSLIFEKTKSLEQKNTPHLRAPLLPSSEPLFEQKTSPSAAVSIALDNLAEADAEESERRTKRGYGTLQLLKIARPHRHWLYYACGVLLIRLPLSLSIPHWVAETIGCLIAQDYVGAQRNIVFLCVAGSTFPYF
jgi:hypothetical protein